MDIWFLIYLARKHIKNRGFGLFYENKKRRDHVPSFSFFSGFRDKSHFLWCAYLKHI